MRKLHNDIVQGSDEWRKMRIGRLTSSILGEFIFTKGKDELGLGAKIIPHLNKVAAEYYTGETDDSDYENEKMLRGKELEPIARDFYEMMTFEKIEEIGFATYGKYLGDSPDGIIGTEGTAEVKCRKLHLHYNMLDSLNTKGVFKLPSKDKAQCLWHPFVLGRKWCDYMSFHPDFPEHQRLLIQRVNLTEEISEILEAKKIAIETYIDRSLESIANYNL